MARGNFPNGRRLVQSRFRLDGLICPALERSLRPWAKAPSDRDGGVSSLGALLGRQALDGVVGLLGNLLQVRA